MTSQSHLFYQGKYKQLFEDIEKNQTLSMQDTHNLAVARFLATGQSPLSLLENIVKQIRDESPNESWPSHPSWNLVYYHICLYYFTIGDYQECTTRLKDLWDNSGTADRLIVLVLSLLSIEFFIRTGNDSFLEKSLLFLQQHFPTQDSINSFLSSQIQDHSWIEKVTSTLLYASLRTDVSKASRMPIESAKQQFEGILNSINISPDTKNRPLQPVKKIIPIALSALFLDDKNKYNMILETSEQPDHFAILNNRGIYEMLQKRYSSALLYFSKALDARHNNSIIYPFHQVIYNIALSFLIREKPKKAFKFFHSIIPLMSQSPYLWLRLAESCVSFYKQRVAKLRKTKQLTPVIARTFCTTTRKFYLLPQSDYKLFCKYPLIPPNNDEGNRYLFDLNLDFADKCSRNAISLCKPVDDQNLAQVRHAAELICSYVSLELGDGKRAGEMGKAVYSDNSISPQMQFLSKIYSAQSNAITGDVKGARAMLSKLMIENNKVMENEALTLHSITFALVYMAAQDMRKAQDQIKKLQESTASTSDVVLTKVAFELKNRKTQTAIATLNQFSAVNNLKD